MDKEQFLKSGLLQQFVLGLTTPEEDQIVNNCLMKFPELKSEVNDLHQSLEQYASNQLLNTDNENTASSSVSPSPVVPVFAYRNITQVAIMLAIAGLLTWSFINQQKQIEQIGHLKAEYAALEAFCQQNQQKYNTAQALLTSAHAKDTQPVLLKGTALAPGHFAVAYWNPTAKGAWVDPTDLPSLPANKQYQVWADIDGEMISVGLIPTNSKELVTIHYLPQAESLNVTQEKLGGTDHPTVSLLTVNGIL